MVIALRPAARCWQRSDPLTFRFLTIHHSATTTSRFRSQRPPPVTLPAHMHPSRSFQGLILTLHNYWADYGCVILQPYDMEVGAGTFHPATTLRALGPKPWNAAYVQPSRRPEGRPLRREPEPAAALLPVPGDPEAQPARTCRSSISARWRRSASTRCCTTSASSRTTGKARRSAPGGSAGNAGATAWKCRSSPISSRSAASNARRSRASSPTGWSGSPCMCRASTMSTT